MKKVRFRDPASMGLSVLVKDDDGVLGYETREAVRVRVCASRNRAAHLSLLDLLDKWEAQGDYPARDIHGPLLPPENHPSLFEIIGLTNTPYINGKGLYKRILIRRLSEVNIF